MGYDLMIAAYPTQLFEFMVTQETEDVDAAEVYHERAYFSDMLDSITQIREMYPITTISVYGPLAYIKQLKDIIEGRFEHYDVKLCPAGV